MKTVITFVSLVFSLLFYAQADAQNVRFYKSDGTTVKIGHELLDSIVSESNEKQNSVYLRNGKVLKLQYSELDSIVASEDNEKNPNFIDLGLSVKWAAFNVGAERPEDYGDYFAWGEISPKSAYLINNCSSYGKPVKDISGNRKVDAASAIWGNDARIPTFDEYYELRDKCQWTWTTVNDVNGYTVTGPNGKSIFLPAAGTFCGDSICSLGENGSYWTGNAYEEDSLRAYNHLFNSDGYWGSMRLRSDGLSVRPVLGDIRSVSYTGDTLKVGEHFAEISLMFSYVPVEGIEGGVEYYSTATGIKQIYNMFVKENGEYRVTLNDLQDQTKYKYRSFIIIENKYVYGNTEEFITKTSLDTLTKGEWIDLGLSVKWASHNLGALNPEDLGDYYAWGELYPKQKYDETNSETTGKDMNDISGDSDYDAAAAMWGDMSRMPKKEEIQELFDKCTWQWTPRNGVNGMLITGPNGNSIFIPAGGSRIGETLNGNEQNGCYWSSSPRENDNRSAYGFMFAKKTKACNWYRRAHGRIIRPVKD